MHDSGDDLHHLPSYEKGIDPRPDSRSDVSAGTAGTADLSMKNIFLWKD